MGRASVPTPALYPAFFFVFGKAVKNARNAVIPRLSAHQATPPTQTPQRSFQWVAAGTHATPAPNRAHSGSQGETGAFRAGVVSLPSDRFARFRNHAWPGVRTALPLLGLGRVCSRRAQRACGTATRSCASLFRGVAAPLGCVIPLFFSLTTLMSFTVLLNRFVGTQKIERLFFSYSGAFLEQKA